MRRVESIDDYIRGFPKSTQKLLQQMRHTIHKAAPAAKERISYQMPAFYLNKNLVYFAGYERHIGFYPTSSPMKAFKKELSVYETSKGTVRFPIEEHLPHALIRRIVRFRVAEADPFHQLAAPAQRALARVNITSLKQLTKRTEEQISWLHGIGPDVLKKLRRLLRVNGLEFKQVHSNEPSTQ